MKNHGLTHRIVIYLILLIILTVLYFIPDRLLFESRESLCLHKIILGIECPLCGMTRAAHEMMHFRFFSAWQYNFTIYFLTLFIIADLVNYLLPHTSLEIIRKILLILFLVSLGIIYTMRIVVFFGWM